MKPQTICCLALLLLAAVQSAATEGQNTTPQPSDDDTSGPSIKAEENRSVSEESTSSTPYEPFIPSESISGDSAVAFPVDI